MGFVILVEWLHSCNLSFKNILIHFVHLISEIGKMPHVAFISTKLTEGGYFEVDALFQITVSSCANQSAVIM